MKKKIITALTLSLISLSSLEGQDEITYTKDISPIIYNNCTCLLYTSDAADE